MSAYSRDFYETKYMSFLIKIDELLKKYNKIREKVKNSMFNSELVCNKKYLKAKIKSYHGKIITNFYNHKIQKEDFQFICLLVILIDSVSRTSKYYYPQKFLEQCKYIAKKKMPDYITDSIEISSDSDREDSDEENSNEKK